MENVTGHSAQWVGFQSSAASDDALWILVATFMILTMQTGFGLLEAGVVSQKNETNIMVKNAVDMIFGGMAFWLFGFGFAFGTSNEGSASYKFSGFGDFALTLDDSEERMGGTYTMFVFQLSFAATATTIVSGAIAERTKLTSYIIFAFFNILTYCFPAHWIWGGGFLAGMGVVDVAGSGVVHLKGGISALVGALMLGPRKGRYARGNSPPPLGNGANVVVGTLMLWWGWIGFNCGSTFGVSGDLWRVTAKTAATTLVASMGGGFVGVISSLMIKRGVYDVSDMCNSVLGGLVAITAPCAVVLPWEAVIIGGIGGLITFLSVRLFDRLYVDDPVGAISVHGMAGIWGMLSVGLFMREDQAGGLNGDKIGLFHGGGWDSLGAQALATVCIVVWSAGTTFLIFGILAAFPKLGLRMSEEDELAGADYVEHKLGYRAIKEWEEAMASLPEMRSTNCCNCFHREKQLERIEIAGSSDKLSAPSPGLARAFGTGAPEKSGSMNAAYVSTEGNNGLVHRENSDKYEHERL